MNSSLQSTFKPYFHLMKAAKINDEQRWPGVNLIAWGAFGKDLALHLWALFVKHQWWWDLAHEAMWKLRKWINIMFLDSCLEYSKHVINASSFYNYYESPPSLWGQYYWSGSCAVRETPVINGVNLSKHHTTEKWNND